MRRSFYGLLITLVLGGAPFFVVHAQSDALQSAVADVSQSVTKLSEVKDASTTASTSPEYLAAQKSVLIDIYNLSLEEIKGLRKKINIAKSEVEAELVVVREDFLTNLDSFASRIEALKKDAAAATSTELIQVMAGEFKSWRSAVYDPKLKSMFDLTLLFWGRSVLKTGDNRFERVALDVKKLDELFGTKARRLKAYLSLAATDLKDARKYYSEARTAFLESLQPAPIASSTIAEGGLVASENASATVLSLENVTSSTAATTSPAAATTTASIAPLEASTTISSTTLSTSSEQIEVKASVIAPITVQSVLEKSLDRVTDAYRIFLEMSKLAKKLLAGA